MVSFGMAWGVYRAVVSACRFVSPLDWYVIRLLSAEWAGEIMVSLAAGVGADMISIGWVSAFSGCFGLAAAALFTSSPATTYHNNKNGWYNLDILKDNQSFDNEFNPVSWISFGS